MEKLAKTSRADIIISVLDNNGGSLQYDELIDQCNEIAQATYELAISDKRFHRDRFKSEIQGDQKMVYLTEEYYNSVNKETVNSDKSQNSTVNIPIIPLQPENYYIPEEQEIIYINQGNESIAIAGHMNSGKPLILRGASGLGKTLCLTEVAKKRNIPIVRVNCNEYTSESDLYGRSILINDQSYFVLGLMTTAIELANMESEAILVFEELNALTPNMQKVPNSLLDNRQDVVVPDINKRFYVYPDCKLYVFATMNPSTYGGVFELNTDCIGRWGTYDFQYPDEETEKEIVMAYKFAQEIAKIEGGTDIINGIIKVANENRIGKFSYKISTRDVCNLLEALLGYYNVTSNNLKVATKMACQCYILSRFSSEPERNVMLNRLQDSLEIIADDKKKEDVKV